MTDTTYPAVIDAPTDPTPTTSQQGIHAELHGFANDAIVAIETWLGTSSAPAVGSVYAQLQALQAVVPATATANQVLAGPATGGPAAPAFRALVTADIATALAAPGPIGGTTPGAATFTTVSVSGQISSTLATGTPPLVVTSTTVVANLNVSQLLGGTWAIPGAIGSTTKNTGAFTTISATGAITSTLATGTAPFTVASTTVVANLNVSQLLGQTWAIPGAIGATTPAAAAFTTVSVTGAITSTLVTGTAPFTVASSTAVANLNASLLLGGTWASPGAIGGTAPGSASFTTVSVNGQITSTLATGTPPLVIASTTNIPNLNASSLNGATFAAPGGIGGGTPGTIAATTLSTTSIAISGLSANQNVYTGASGLLSTSATWTFTPTAGLALAPTAVATGAQTAFQILGAANTGQTSGTEVIDFKVNLNRTVTWATSTPTTQRAATFSPPTYACDTAAQTITTAATLTVTGAPAAGANVTITNSYALWVQFGITQLQALNATTGTFSGSVVTGSGASFGGGFFVPSSSASAVSGNTTVAMYRGNSSAFSANSLVLQAGGSTTAGGGIYFCVNNGTTTNTVMQLTATTFGLFGTTPAAQSTGYGTPTGGAKQASFAAGAITLPNLAAAVAQLILDLKAYGLIGA
jgi:hypothetical protein